MQVNPHSGRNLYFCGLAAYLDGDYQGAVEYYKQVRRELFGRGSTGVGAYGCSVPVRTTFSMVSACCLV